MARQVNTIKTAKVGNTDLELHLDFSSPADPENPSIDDMKSKLTINWDDGSRGTAAPVRVADVLDDVTQVTSGTKLSIFRQCLAELRDAGFDASGVPDV